MIAVLFVIGAVSLNGAVLKIDKSHSEVGFSIKHLMITNVNGDFSDYDADIIYDVESKKFEKFNASVMTASIDTGIEKRDNHLRSVDFFEVEKYPKMTFTMSSYTTDGTEGVLSGDLTIHGVTKKVTFEVENNGMIKDPWGNTRTAFTLETKINRKDFGLNWNKALEAGGVLVGDKVKITIEIEAIVQ
ncbi:MAG: YceI family protein [Arcobacteraceae bacterium]|nr:YceI family protein [Arcobacteraceae bacterium]